MTYWYNIRTGQVEQDADPDRARAAMLMGPYDSQEQAAQALELAQRRTEAWDEEDRRRREEDDGWPD